MSQLSSPILHTAFKAARKAGDFSLRAANNFSSLRPDSKAFKDFAADIARHNAQTITAVLAEAYPDHRIITDGEHPSGKGYEWLVAPLDGIGNYLHGHPQYAVALALRHKGILQEALIFAPERNDLYTASRGKGAWHNDRRIRVSARIELGDALVAAGFDGADNGFALLSALLAQTAGVRCEDAAVLDWCAVASGQRDGFIRFGLNPCQIAAGALLVQEAGGIVTDPQGDERWLESGDAVAANPKILAQLLQTAAKAR
ncbi:inositol monophosphatase family protein [Conchiformibius kuhniae]|uniref:Inositol monophosphatase family protein n=1 Tax=Conchiformibius kuhniae TaxID=211502 RepID=A0A8T9MZ83_9NEIS|nr:inositol monophosphatase [Conchiformibius kuhniae]UOP05103.1 inositol monophosphatase [Conchiformibius kuhniae]